MKDSSFEMLVGNSSPVGPDAPVEPNNPWLDPALMAKYEEALTIAAKVANETLPLLLAQRTMIVTALQKVDAAIANLTFMADGKPGALAAQEATFSLSVRDVEQVLYESEDPLKVNEIMERIKAKFGREWASSTVYAHLTKMKNQEFVVNNGGRWIMTESGRGNVTF